MDIFYPLEKFANLIVNDVLNIQENLLLSKQLIFLFMIL